MVAQIKDGNRSIIGLMIESNIHEGNQSSEQPRSEMKYGVSVTDEMCIRDRNIGAGKPGIAYQARQLGLIFNAVIGVLLSVLLAVFSGNILKMVSIAPALDVYKRQCLHRFTYQTTAKTTVSTVVATVTIKSTAQS